MRKLIPKFPDGSYIDCQFERLLNNFWDKMLNSTTDLAHIRTYMTNLCLNDSFSKPIDSIENYIRHEKH